MCQSARKDSGLNSVNNLKPNSQTVLNSLLRKVLLQATTDLWALSDTGVVPQSKHLMKEKRSILDLTVVVEVCPCSLIVYFCPVILIKHLFNNLRMLMLCMFNTELTNGCRVALLKGWYWCSALSHDLEETCVMPLIDTNWPTKLN